MKMNKTKIVISAALVMAVSAGVAKAADPDMTQTQDRVRTELNLQTRDNAATPAQVGGQNMGQLKQQKMHQKKFQVRNEYKKNNQVRQSGSASGSMMRQSNMNKSRGKH